MYSILVTELMADPDPSVLLPESEYIELFNNSTETVQLAGWQIEINESVFKIRESILLNPGQYLLLTKSRGCPLYDSTVLCASVTGLSLPNSGGTISVRSPSGKSIHGIRYTAGMHSNAVKARGGWSVEMKDIQKPCVLEANWESSNDLSGGTPGRNNSMHQLAEDRPGFVFTNSVVRDSLNAVLTANYGMDSSLIAATLRFNNWAGPPINSWNLSGLENNELHIQFAKAIDSISIYQLEVTGINTCISNLSMSQIVRLARCRAADSADIIFNEIMFHPSVNEDEYIELYNNSTKTVDLSKLRLTKLKASGSADDPIDCSQQPIPLYPGDFIVLTKTTNHLWEDFNDNSIPVIALAGFPALSDDSGLLLLEDVAGRVIDKLNYNKDWHLPLIVNEAGVGLERINYNAPSNAVNWTSAAAPNYGTPGRVNSQQSNIGIVKAGFSIEPLTFTPDRDGISDLLFINYSIQTPSTIGHVRIADKAGRIIRTIANNELLGVSGRWSWNGYDDENRLMPTGIYIVIVDLFDLSGKKTHFRQAVTLARRI